jgi:hypothetical protein
MVAKRLGIPQGSPITNDFPSGTRTALVYVLSELDDKGFLRDKKEIIRELNRIGRFTSSDLKELEDKSFTNQIAYRLYMLRWFEVMTFCERVFDKYLCSVVDSSAEYYVSLDEVQQFFSKEVNQLLIEDNLAFNFENGLFQRRGRAQTHKAIERVGTVLSDLRLERVKSHFNKALKFFNQRPSQDAENCVKEALCALEACVEILTGKKASQDFDLVIKQLKGNNPQQIPSPLAESIIKVHSYRGSGQGVSHAAIEGNRVSTVDVELVLSLIATYITYFVDLFPPEEEIPF